MRIGGKSRNPDQAADPRTPPILTVDRVIKARQLRRVIGEQEIHIRRHRKRGMNRHPHQTAVPVVVHLIGDIDKIGGQHLPVLDHPHAPILLRDEERPVRRPVKHSWLRKTGDDHLADEARRKRS